MSEIPEIRYAKAGDVHIAYQVLGEGPIDFIWVPGFVTNIEMLWEFPPTAQIFKRLSAFTRLMIFDKRGSGLSDRLKTAPTLEERMDDARAVLDAVGSEHAVICGNSEGGPMAALFAAAYPERTSALVLYSSFARTTQALDYPCGAQPGDNRFERYIEHHWGEGTMGRLFTPTIADEPWAQDFWRRMERNSASPADAVSIARLQRDIDIRSILPTIQAPTMVLHRRGDLAVPIEHGRYLAEHIPNARLVELDGIDHAPATIAQADELVDEIEEFVTGARRPADPDRVLATVLFSDIVDSTARAASSGDRGWTELLDAHDHGIRRQLERFRGNEVKTTGDGFVATFDGPARAIHCAKAMHDTARSLGLGLRVGLHTGEIELRGNDVAGIAVHIGQRVSAAAGSGETLVSRTVTDLVVGSGLQFDDRGEHELKGVPGTWQLYAVKS